MKFVAQESVLSHSVVLFGFFGGREVLVAALLLADDVAPEDVAITERTLAVDREKEVRPFVTSGVPEMLCEADEVVDAGTPERETLNLIQFGNRLNANTTKQLLVFVLMSIQ